MDSQKGIETATDNFLSGMSWHGFTDFQQECVTSWTKLFATNEIQFTDKPLTTSLLLSTICHAAQIHTFRLVAQMVALTNLRIGPEHKKWDWEQFKEKRKEVSRYSLR